MNRYEVVLLKSYIVVIHAEDANKAKELSEYYTGESQNISTIDEERTHNFKIESIDCRINEAIDSIKTT